MEQTKLSRPVSGEAAAVTHAFNKVIDYAKKVKFDMKKVVMGTAASVALLTSLLAPAVPAHASDLSEILAVVGGITAASAIKTNNPWSRVMAGGGGAAVGHIIGNAIDGSSSQRVSYPSNYNYANNYPVYDNYPDRPIRRVYESPNVNVNCRTVSTTVERDGYTVQNETRRECVTTSNEHYVGTLGPSE